MEKRTGLLLRKLGMTRAFGENGLHVPMTVLSLEQCRVVGQKVEDKHGYNAIVVGCGQIKDKKSEKRKRITKPEAGVFAANNVDPAQKVVEFRVAKDNLIEIGSEFQVDHFVVGQYVDIRARSVGKGFAGAMKRHNFSGLRATHGVSVSHRSHGSTGHRREPGRVFKGKKMAGHMGARNTCQPNLLVHKIDLERGLLLVRGAVPGSKGSWVTVVDAVKKKPHGDTPAVGSFKAPSVESIDSGAKENAGE